MPAENDIVKVDSFHTPRAVINSRHQHRTGVPTNRGPHELSVKFFT
jgi:hypothetical protein